MEVKHCTQKTKKTGYPAQLKSAKASHVFNFGTNFGTTKRKPLSAKGCMRIFKFILKFWISGTNFLLFLFLRLFRET